MGGVVGCVGITIVGGCGVMVRSTTWWMDGVLTAAFCIKFGMVILGNGMKNTASTTSQKAYCADLGSCWRIIGFRQNIAREIMPPVMDIISMV